LGGSSQARRAERIAVTGAAGFIGSRLAERLLADGHEVVGIDCFSPNYPRERKERNLAGLAREARFSLVEDDMCAPSAAKALHGCRSVVHMAAIPGVRTADRERLWQTNVTGTARLVDILRQVGVSRVILASSSSVYGGCDGPAGEDRPPAPESFYGRTKLAAEGLCRRSPLETVVLRYFTVYGERQRPDMAFAAFIAAALDDGVAPLIADGGHRRHFTYVGDAVDATVLALHAPPGGIYNVAGPSTATVAGGLRLIEAALGKPVPVRRVPAANGEPSSTNADLSRAARELGWEPRVTLRDGLRRQIGDALDQRTATRARSGAPVDAGRGLAPV
jgi:UDP-glucuronate 4-epimerase